MPVPDFQSLMKPVLEALSDGAATRISEVRARVAASEALASGDLQEMLPSGRQSVFDNVGEGALRNFAGAIDAAGTTKGVFVTTASFTRAAREYVARSPKRIVLIDGEELARLMVAHGVGVRTRVRHEIKRIDEDYFDQETM